MNKFSEFEAFAAVVDQGCFTDAAKQVGISKSAISKQIAALEARLGARLLNRSTRRVSPTEIGTVYYDRIRKILNEADEADALVSNLQSEPTGILKVGCEADFGIHALSPLLEEFNRQFPKIRLEMELHWGSRNLISSGWDVAVCTGPVSDSDLKVRKIGESRMHLVASPKYVNIHGRPKTLDELQNHKLIHSGSRSDAASWLVSERGGEPRRIRGLGQLAINDGTTQLAAAKAGLGIALQPEFLCGNALKTREVVDVMPCRPPQFVEILALHGFSEHTPPKIRAFVDFLAQNFD